VYGDAKQLSCFYLEASQVDGYYQLREIGTRRLWHSFNLIIWTLAFDLFLGWCDFNLVVRFWSLDLKRNYPSPFQTVHTTQHWKWGCSSEKLWKYYTWVDANCLSCNQVKLLDTSEMDCVWHEGGKDISSNKVNRHTQALTHPVVERSSQPCSQASWLTTTARSWELRHLPFF